MSLTQLSFIPLFLLSILSQAQSANHDILLIIDQNSDPQLELINQISSHFNTNEAKGGTFRVLNVDVESEGLRNATVLLAKRTPAPIHPEDSQWLYHFIKLHPQPIALLQYRDGWRSETSQIVQSASICTHQGTIHIGYQPHRALLCNGMEAIVEQSTRMLIANDRQRPVAGLFATAVVDDETKQRNKHKHGIMLGRRHHNLDPAHHHTKHTKRTSCKYRKSCYNTGQLPDQIQQREQMVMKENPLAFKLRCKYRKSCYEKGGSGQAEKSGKHHRVLSGRSAPMRGGPRKKRTLKEMADIALRHVHEQEQRGALRPKPKMAIVKASLSKAEEKLKKKLTCKYRKSCYESGIPPNKGQDDTYFLEAVHFIESHVHTPGQQAANNASYAELDPQIKRLYCKYRKSCYNTGKRPVITHESKFKYHQMMKKDELEVPIQLKCHYRKSCYETGRIPELYWSTPAKQAAEPIADDKDAPSTVGQLKLRCKYRKSCYSQHSQEQAQFEEVAKAMEEHHQHYVQQQTTAQVEEATEASEEQDVETTNKRVPRKEVSKKRKTKSQKKEDTRASHKRYEILESDTPKVVHHQHRHPIKHRMDQVALRRKQAKFTAKHKHIVITQIPQRARKLLCKYRKSCYANGTLYTFTAPQQEQQQAAHHEQVMQMDQAELKLFCKYRKSCYEEIGTQHEEQASEKHHRVLGGKQKPIEAVKARPKKTVKEMAEIVLQRVDKKEKSAAERVVPKMEIAKQKMSKADKEKQRRLKCRYRKSCYESGVRPYVEYDNVVVNAYRYITSHVHTPSDQQMPNVTFDEMDQDHKRLLCKYRKSCYESGARPQIDHEERFKYKHVINKEELAIPLQIRCHYRKSCYETGIVPPLTVHYLVEQQQQQTVTKLPQTIYQLKVHCKYRKSCYVHQTMDQPPAQPVKPQVKPKLVKLPSKVVKEPTPTTAPDTTPSIEIEPEPSQSELTMDAMQSEHVTEEAVKETITPELESSEEESEKSVRETVKKPKASKKESARASVKRTTAIESQKPMDAKKESRRVKQQKPAKEKPEVVSTPEPVKEKQKIAPTPKPVKEKPKMAPSPKPSKREKPRTEETKVKPPKQQKTAPVKPKPKVKPMPTAPSKVEPQEEDIIQETHEKEESVPVIEKKEKQMDADSKKLPKVLGKIKKPISVEQMTKQMPRVSLHHKEIQYKPPPPEEEEQIEVSPIKEVHIEGEVDTLHEKLRCKYRKSCYNDKLLPHPFEGFSIKHVTKKEEQHVPTQLRCKYRKSCYESGEAPRTDTNFHVKHLVKKQDEHLPVPLRCKYRKSCYETGKVPDIDQELFIIAAFQNLMREYQQESEELHREMSQEERKLSCKYRKSCYESGKLPNIDNESIKTIADTMKETQLSMHLRCKYRKSCYTQYGIPIAKSRSIKPEAVISQPSAVPVSEQVKVKTTGEERKVQSASTDESDENKKKMKKSDKEAEYMQIKTQVKPLSTKKKLRCKYRLKCYQGIPMHKMKHELRKQAIPIKSLTRQDGRPCSIYHISCRKMAGLPAIKQRAPIGPNGRRLCRKKPKVEAAAI